MRPIKERSERRSQSSYKLIFCGVLKIKIVEEFKVTNVIFCCQKLSYFFNLHKVGHTPKESSQS